MDIEIDETLYETRPSYIIEEQDLRILKSILSDDNIAREFANTYDETFFIGDAIVFAKTIINYIKIYNAIPTNRIILENYNESKEKCEYILNELENITFNKNEFEYDLSKIKDRLAKIKIKNLRNNFNDINLDNDIDWLSTINNIKNQVSDVEAINKKTKSVHIQKTLKEYMPEFKEDFSRKIQNPELSKGILTGYSYLDYITNGLFPANLLIIGGESSSGKSMFLSNMATQMWMQNNNITSSTFEKGYNIQYFSLEMPFESCARRVLARLSDLSIYSLRDCKIGPDKINRLNNAANFIRKYPYEFEIIDIPRGVTLEQIELRYNDALARGIKHDVVVVDYLGLMESSNRETGDDWLKLGEIAGGLHEFARFYNIVVLTAVQLNRPQKSIKDSSDLIGMHRIGRSSLIMHHANIGIQIETRKNEYSYADLIYHIIKNRDGQQGKHNLLKKFQNATLIDNETYEPEIEDEFLGIATNEDLSKMLEDIGWFNE